MLRDCASERLHSRATLEGLDTALRQQGLKVRSAMCAWFGWGIYIRVCACTYILTQIHAL